MVDVRADWSVVCFDWPVLCCTSCYILWIMSGLRDHLVQGLAIYALSAITPGPMSDTLIYLFIFPRFYGLNICALPLPFICWKLAPKMVVLGSGAFGKWLGHEGGVLVNGIKDLIKEAQENFLAPSATWGYSGKMAVNECCALRLPSLQNCDKLISVVFKPHSLW